MNSPRVSLALVAVTTYLYIKLSLKITSFFYLILFNKKNNSATELTETLTIALLLLNTTPPSDEVDCWKRGMAIGLIRGDLL